MGQVPPDVPIRRGPDTLVDPVEPGPPPSRREAFLVVHLPAGVERWVEVVGTVLRVGRGGDVAADLTEADPARSVSRRHAEIRVAGDSFVVDDLGSTNGTAVGFLPLTPGIPAPVVDGTTIYFGTVAATFRILGSP